jgi:endonuclease YncB( thermonuclease family)
VQRRRRLFRPAASPRRWRGPLVAAAGALIVAAVSGLGLPPALMGSAPREQDWSALAAEVRVVDGDTLQLGDRMLRLSGIDAPERGRNCADGGRAFDCGAAAAEALSRLVNGRSVLCRVHGRDRFGRGLGVCTAGGAELNEGLVAAGWAIAEDGDAPMRAMEAQARQSGRGLWARSFTRPEEWQRRN